MASRKSRSRRQSNTGARSRAAERREAASQPVQGDTRTSAPVAGQTEPAVEWATEYHYIVSDLRQLLLVSGALFAVMLLIGYFL